MKWIVTIGVAVLLMIALPFAITAAKASMRRKGRFAGATLAIGMAFMSVLDPAKAAAVEETQKKGEQGDDEAEDKGELT